MMFSGHLVTPDQIERPWYAWIGAALAAITALGALPVGWSLIRRSQRSRRRPAQRLDRELRFWNLHGPRRLSLLCERAWNDRADRACADQALVRAMVDGHVGCRLDHVDHRPVRRHARDKLASGVLPGIGPCARAVALFWLRRTGQLQVVVTRLGRRPRVLKALGYRVRWKHGCRKARAACLLGVTHTRGLNDSISFHFVVARRSRPSSWRWSHVQRCSPARSRPQRHPRPTMATPSSAGTRRQAPAPHTTFCSRSSS